jgi:hypothetical protein
MSTNAPLLHQEVAALIHHVELNRDGWWEKAVQRIILSAIWLCPRNPTAAEIRTKLNEAFHLVLGDEKFYATLDTLKLQDQLVELPDYTFKIADAAKIGFEKEIADAEKVAKDARNVFLALANSTCPAIEAEELWDNFEKHLLTPLITDVGANAHRLMAGERIKVDSKLAERFYKLYPDEHHSALAALISGFLDPKKPEVRAHVSRMMHARFCVEASGLPEDVLKKLRDSVGKQIRFRLFVDTNFLFSLLDLHENPSNAAAQDLRDLVLKLKGNLNIQFFVAPITIEEAKTSINAARAQLAGLPLGRAVARVGLRVGLSGMAQRFLYERQGADAALTADEWFGPYLSDFVPMARAKGVELFNEKLDGYSTRQDVVDDINLVLKLEDKFPRERRKSYEKVAHDMVLWHFVNDKRGGYVESPLDAQDWILTIDYRLITFDEHRQKQLRRKVPLCIHPTSLIQLLQFWVPRNQEFEEAVLGSLRLPFLFQPIDVAGERTTIRILKNIGRFAERDSIPEETMTRVVLNDGLRGRLSSEHSAEAEITLVRDALVEEMRNRSEAEGKKVQELQGVVNEREAALRALDADKQASNAKASDLASQLADERARADDAHRKMAVQDERLASIEQWWQVEEEARKRRVAFRTYLAFLFAVVLLSGGGAWVSPRLFPGSSTIIGTVEVRLLVAVLVFIVAHLLLELVIRRDKRISELWPFIQVTKFRKWLWGLVVLGFVLGIIGNLYANRIQKKLDERDVSTPVSQPATFGGSYK